MMENMMMESDDSNDLSWNDGDFNGDDDNNGDDDDGKCKEWTKKGAVMAGMQSLEMEPSINDWQMPAPL